MAVVQGCGELMFTFFFLRFSSDEWIDSSAKILPPLRSFTMARRLTRVTRHLSTLPSPPISALVAPGRCAFGGDDWIAAPLLERAVLSHDTIRVSFGLPDRTLPLNLATCACILARGGKGGDGEPVVRPYTPTSTNSMLGAFELVVKVYPDGTLSRAMSEMAIGDALHFKHVPQNVKVQYPFSASHVAMLVGGTGITPMVQALHAILGTPGDTTVITMLLGNKTEEDILLRTQLDHWSAAFPHRLRITHVLSDAPPPPPRNPRGAASAASLLPSSSVPTYPHLRKTR